MKKISLLPFVLILLLMRSSPAGNQPNPSEAGPLLLTIIVDTSPTAGKIKEDLQAVLYGLAKNLKPNDHMALYTAHGGSPRLCLAWHMDSTNNQVPPLENCWKSIRFAAVTRADIAQALQVALQAYQSADPESAKAILVLGDARFSDDQIRDIKTALTQAQHQHIQITFTVGERSHRHLLLEATQGRCEALLLGQDNWQEWLDKIRSQNHFSETIQKLPHKTTPLKASEPLATPPENPPSLIPLESASPAMGGIERYWFPVYPVPVDSNCPSAVPPVASILKPEKRPTEVPVAPCPQATTPIHNPPVVTQIEPVSPPARTQPTKSRVKDTRFWVGSLVLLLLMASGWAYYHKNRAGSHSPSSDETSRKKSYRLLGLCNGFSYDLGEEVGIHRITVGSHANSPIPFEDPQIEPHHLQLTYRKGYLLVYNRSKIPVKLDGMVLNCRQKHRVLLPVQIQITDKTRLTLLHEEIKKKNPSEPSRENRGDL